MSEKHPSHSHKSKSKSKSKSSHSHSHSSRHSRPVSDTDEWIEKPSVAPPPAPTKPPVDTYSTFTPGSPRALADGTSLTSARLEPSLTDGYGEGELEDAAGQFGAARGSGDFFGDLGTERKRKEIKRGVDPTETMGQSSRELNKSHWQPDSQSSTTSTAPPPMSGSPAPGSSGSSWRMSKLRRTYELAEEEGRPVEEVAKERYGSLGEFDDAREERRVLDERGGGRGRGGRDSVGGAGVQGRRVYTEEMGGLSRSSSSGRASFRKPGEASTTERSAVGSPAPRSANTSRPGTPVPSVFTPPISSLPRTPSNLASSSIPPPTAESEPQSILPPLSQSELNKLQAKVIKAKLLNQDKEVVESMEREFERERKRTAEATETGTGGGKGQVQVEMVPTLDGRGRLYDLGAPGEMEEEVGEKGPPGKRRKKDPAFQSHDPKTGLLLARSATDDSTSLAELVRQERFGGGSSSQKEMDKQFAEQIARNAKYQNDLDWRDDNAEVLAREGRKGKDAVMKRAFAVQDYAKTKKALENCTLCYTDSGAPPQAGVIATGTKAYLALTETEELVKGHCRIIPVQHHFSSLEADEDTWDEIKNFMKTLMQMFAAQDKGVVFFESCISLKNQKHTWIEAIPVPFDLFDEIPAYFQEAILSSEQEWSQHQKLITFTSTRPFRRSLVPNMPYFAVQWDYRGERGYGHVIEGIDDAPERDNEGYELRGEAGEKGAGEFPRWFATEIIGSMLELEPRAWRKPRRMPFAKNKERVAEFRGAKGGYEAFDWTTMLASSA